MASPTWTEGRMPEGESKSLSMRDYLVVSSTLLSAELANPRVNRVEKNGWAVEPAGSPENMMSLNRIFAEC